MSTRNSENEMIVILCSFSRDNQSTHSSKVRGLVDHSCALFLLDIVIHHHLERSFLPTLKTIMGRAERRGHPRRNNDDKRNFWSEATFCSDRYESDTDNCFLFVVNNKNSKRDKP